MAQHFPATSKHYGWELFQNITYLIWQCRELRYLKRIQNAKKSSCFSKFLRPMRPRRKPGPKSGKPSNSAFEKVADDSKNLAADLGETDTSCSQDNGLVTDDHGFRSPSADIEGTDYGLEFTNTGSRHVDVSKEHRPDGIDSTLGKKNENCTVTKRKESSTVQVAATAQKPLEGPEILLAAQTGSVSTLSRKTTARKSKSQLNFLKTYRKLAASVDFMIPRAAFARVVREIILAIDTDVRFITATALEALQVATEAYVEGRLQDANILALHSHRVTLMAKDMELINFLRANR